VYGPAVSVVAAVSPWEKVLIVVLVIHAALSIGFVALAWRDGIVERADLRYVVNTTGKDGLFAIISIVAVVDHGRRLMCVLLLIGAYACLIVGEIFELLFAQPGEVKTWPKYTEPRQYLRMWLIGDVVFIALFALLYLAAKSAR
jgi:hypothetical protein